MSLPALLLKISNLSIGVRGERPTKGSKRGLEHAATMPVGPRKRQTSDDEVFTKWTRDLEVDQTSMRIRNLAETKKNKYVPYDKDSIEVEIPCDLFARLSHGVGAFNTRDGYPDFKEPTHWNFEDTHRYLKDAEREGRLPKMDQPWLEAQYAKGGWEIFSHEGRHRNAWVQKKLGYKNMTILIGLYWDAEDDNFKRFKGVTEMDVFYIKGIEDTEEKDVSARLIKNPREDGAEFVLQELP